MEEIRELKERLERERPVEWEAFPDIGLYMDQLISYMPRQLIHYGEGESLTSAMVNNYIKDGAMPRAEGKRYSRTHLAYLTALCALKQVLSVKDAGLLLAAASEGRPPQKLYEQFREDKGCSVAMNPCTGEVLALVSTPSYDDNAFILGLSDAQWSAWNGDEARPLYNRFRQTWCPGSTFKPVTAAIGLSTGAIDPGKDYGSEGLRWQKDRSWGSYYVTTLHTYEPVTLENALIYSDNIYFAKTALAIGAEDLTDALDQLGFGQALPFEIAMAKSQYSNTDTIETEIQLADSGYGQGQVLVKSAAFGLPLHRLLQ